jgi:Cu2+-exporting ATPase
MGTTPPHSLKDYSMHGMNEHSAHTTHQGHVLPATKGMAHVGHGADHTGHEQISRVRFWWCLLLSILVLLNSGMIQMWLGFTSPAFLFSEWNPFLLSIIIFAMAAFHSY